MLLHCGKLLLSAGSQVFGHLSQSLLVDVVNESNADKLANSTEGIQACDQPAKVCCSFSGLTDGAESGLIADQGSTHDGNDGCGANALSQLTEEGVQCVNDALLALAELPLLVINGITHHGPGNAVIEAHAQTEEYQTDHVNDQLDVSGAQGEAAHDRTAYQAGDRADGGNFFFAVLLNQLGGQGHKEEHGQETDHHDQTGQGSLTEVGREHNGVCGGGGLHAQEHTHGSDGAANSGTVLHESAEGLDQIDFLTAFCVELCVLVTADGDILDHKDKEDEADNTHDQGCPEYILAKQDFDLATGQGTQDLITDFVSFTSEGIGVEIFGSECGFCTFGDLNLIQEPGGSIISDLIPDEHRQNNTRQNVADCTADGAENGKLSPLTGIVGNDVEHRAVRDVCHGVSSIPNDVAKNEENCLNNGARVGEGQEYGSTANQKTDCADHDVRLVLADLVLLSVAVDEGANQGVIDCIPCLHEKQQDGEQTGLHKHVNQPEGLDSAFQTKAHVAAEVAGCVAKLVTNAKLAVTLIIQGDGLFCHYYFLLNFVGAYTHVNHNNYKSGFKY